MAAERADALPAQGAGITRVAFLGLGIMGAPMARNLLKGGFELSVWTHTEGKAERFASEHGAGAAATPREAAEGADAAVTMVVDSPEVEEVLLGGDGAAQSLNQGAVCVEMSTIAPSAAVKIARRLEQGGLLFLEAPVSGSRPKAEDGTLTIMAGGAERAFERARPLLEAMGEKIVQVGPQGHGQMAKVLTNTMAATHAAVLGEAVTIAREAGLDRDAFLQVAASSAGASTVLDLKGKPMFEHDFEPSFKLEHMLKDVRHALAEARDLGVDPPLAEVVERLYADATEDGHGGDDFAAIVTEAEKRA